MKMVWRSENTLGKKNKILLQKRILYTILDAAKHQSISTCCFVKIFLYKKICNHVVLDSSELVN